MIKEKIRSMTCDYLWKSHPSNNSRLLIFQASSGRQQLNLNGSHEKRWGGSEQEKKRESRNLAQQKRREETDCVSWEVAGLGWLEGGNESPMKLPCAAKKKEGGNRLCFMRGGRPTWGGEMSPQWSYLGSQKKEGGNPGCFMRGGRPTWGAFGAIVKK